jgi:hypothetical protein
MLPAELYVVIRDPEKDPTSDDLESLRPHPSLVQALNDLLNQPLPDDTMHINPQLLVDEGLERQLLRAEAIFAAVEDRETSDEDEDNPLLDDQDEGLEIRLQRTEEAILAIEDTSDELDDEDSTVLSDDESDTSLDSTEISLILLHGMLILLGYVSF